MIAFEYDGDGAVTTRHLRGVGVESLGVSGVLVVGHLRKLEGLDLSNAIDVSTLDPDALTAPLWQLTVVEKAVVVDVRASEPMRAVEPALSTEQEATVQALITAAFAARGL